MFKLTPINKIFGKAENKKNTLIRLVYKKIRPSSYPYISGDSFRSLAQHVFDETNTAINPELVKQGQIVFVATHFAEEYFRTIHPKINHTYILITHNSDNPVDANLASHLDEKIIRWYAQNVEVILPKIIPIPIGLENLHHYNFGIPSLYNRQRKEKNIIKKNRIIYGFKIRNNPEERKDAFRIASQHKLADELTGCHNQNEYLKILRSYKFIISPPGNGLDTHRTWESLTVGTVPIVKDSPTMQAFKSLELPLWIVKNWDELLLVDENHLAQRYNELADKFNSKSIFMDYWKNRITLTS